MLKRLNVLGIGYDELKAILWNIIPKLSNY
jgi:hypothetical protein